MIDKYATPTKLFWVDLEMTGLDANEDLILEVAAEITDFDFKTLASYEAIIKQPAIRVIVMIS
jgi:oligoribonuclease (3'-5' exoribonuclease)